MNELERRFDLDNNGKVTVAEMNETEQMVMFDNEDKKQDAQRRMAWFALIGMLLYPFAVVAASVIGHDRAAQILGDMAATYFVSVAAIIAAFYGKEAYIAKNAPAPILYKKEPVLEEPITEKKPFVKRPNL